MSASFSIDLQAVELIIPKEQKISKESVSFNVEVDAASAGGFLVFDKSSGLFTIDRGSTKTTDAGDYTISVKLIP
eukprot:CAMPEP_0116871106 /NCGR_PEP_ID=MMETSP0463-20121206/1327_1 /TAXON_ID=181622 /ORGANISM="Strombidinopsis sp, Strain SopsisLIS2011" /LENGTH=74 /DNA_ID=CAMNT_0004508937 /DNA_START=1662 /DNA_END=1886 /DNA_ORIENTATION=+